MKPRYSFSSRHTGRLENIKKQRQEFPKIVSELINKSDIILEILDARFIDETRNKNLENYIKTQNKEIIYVVNKSDLLDKEKIKDAKKKNLKDLWPHIFVSAKFRKGGRELRERIKIESKKIKKTVDTFGKVAVGIIGYPNTGKSSMINFLVGRSSARIASESGFTKGVQKINLSKEIVLIDSPGVIPHEDYSSSDLESMSKHAKISARSYNSVKNPEIAVASLVISYKNLLEEFYKIDAKGDAEILIEELGRRKGFLKKHGEIDTDKSARFILREWQEGKIRI